MSAPRRIGEILDPTLARLQTSDQGRAFATWARAAGPQIAGGARPRSFSRGVLTVDCTSSVWASELTYLSDQLLRRMAEVAPEHPVRRLRFRVGQGGAEQENRTSAPKQETRGALPAPPDLREARALAAAVRDERLREAIQAALRATAGESSGVRDDHHP